MTDFLKGIKKFSFFEIEKPGKLENQRALNYSLNDMAPVAFKICNKYYYVAGKLKSDSHNNILFRIVKIHPSGKIIREYTPFTDSIIDFDIIKRGEKIYFVIIGTDLRNEGDKSSSKVDINENNQIDKIKVSPSPNSIPSIKIFGYDETKGEIEEKNEAEDENKKDDEKTKEDELSLDTTIYLLVKKGNLNDFYKGENLSGLTEAYTPVTEISHFSVSPFMNVASFSTKDSLVEIKLFSTIKKDKTKYHLINSPDKKYITNIKYATFSNECFLYFTTSNTIYYKRFGDTKLNIVGDEHGATPQNFYIGPKMNILISTPETYYNEEYIFNNQKKGYEKFITKVFGKQIRFIQIFNGYYVFAIYDENKPSLGIYDPKNNIFMTLDDSFKQKDILFILASEDRIYILITSPKSKDIICLKEYEDKRKFDFFYDKKIFDLAYIYAKNWGFSKEQLAEIAKAHAEFLYEKNDFEKSIELYKLTINYLEPTYVIQKFLEDSKKIYLIKYLEELQINREFRPRCKPEILKDFTTVLLNCYIKLKEIDKLNEFIKKQDIKDEVTIKIVVDLCKELNNVELALSFAEKAKKEKMDNIYIQILIDIPKDYKDYLKYMKEIPNYINAIKDIKRKFKVIIDFGKKLLEKEEIVSEVNKTIFNLVDDIINLKNKDPDDEKLISLKFEKIISIYSTEKHLDELEKLFQKIMIEGEYCPKEIISNRIEIQLAIYEKKEKEKKGSGEEHLNKIKEIIENYKDNLDKNYLLMTFKSKGFDQGIAELNKLMELEQDLLQIYMDKKDFAKINEICKKHTEENIVKENKVNYWLQALNYYIDISNKSNINTINKYIIEVLDNLSKQENFSPMNLLDILENAINDNNKIVEIQVIRKFFKGWLKQKGDSLKEDKIEVEENYKKIEEYDKNIKEIHMSAKTFNVTRCASCKSSLDLPFVFFMCGHGYHQNCLDEIHGTFECTICSGKNRQYFEIIEKGKKLAGDPEKYKEELNNENQGNKFDIFADYLGKGVFNQSNNNNSEEKQNDDY